MAKAEFDKLAARAQKALGFTVTAGDAALLLAAESSGRAKGAQGVLAFWDRAYRALAQYRLEHDDAPKAAALGAKIACGSDAGAYRVLHGQGGLDERTLLRRAAEYLEAHAAEFPEYDPDNNILKRCTTDGNLIQTR